MSEVRIEPKASMDYFGMLQTLLNLSSIARKDIDFTKISPNSLKKYIIALDNLIGYMLPKWREDMKHKVGFTIDDVKMKYVEGMKKWSSGDGSGARELWGEAFQMADKIRDAILDILHDKGVLFYSRKVSVYDSSHLYKET